MTLSTIYKMTVSPTEILKLVEKHSSKEQKNEKLPFIFIIDEINRGEISKIFGELFFSIDPGYRGEDGKVKTQYQNMVPEGDVFADGFYVPDNVYIIGTMNDIDIIGNIKAIGKDITLRNHILVLCLDLSFFASISRINRKEEFTKYLGNLTSINFINDEDKR